MNEKVVAFYEVVSADEALHAELQEVTEGVVLEGVSEEEAREAMAEAVAAFAAEHDLDLTAADILAADAEAPEGMLSEAELENVSGGGGCLCIVIGAVKGCGCFLGGSHLNGKPINYVCAIEVPCLNDDFATGAGALAGRISVHAGHDTMRVIGA